MAKDFGLGLAPIVVKRVTVRYPSSMNIVGIVVSTGYYCQDRIFDTNIMHKKMGLMIYA